MCFLFIRITHNKKRIVTPQSNNPPRIYQNLTKSGPDSAPHCCDNDSDLIPAARSTGTSSVVFGAVPFPGCSLNEACSHPPTLDSARLYRFYYSIMPQRVCQEKIRKFFCIFSRVFENSFVIKLYNIVNFPSRFRPISALDFPMHCASAPRV